MALKPNHDLLGIALTQFLILSVAWTFFAVVELRAALPLPDSAALWVNANPTETMVVVTIVATIISSVTLSCFTRASKHALRQYIRSQRYISLADLSMGVAAANASFSFRSRRRYIGPAFGTFLIAALFGLVNSAWTTFLNPTLVNVFVVMNGEELDLGNLAFDAVLGVDMNNTFVFSNGTLVTQPDSSNSLTSLAITGGMTNAAAFASGRAGILNYNNVTYNVSTGGILPTVAEYGSTETVNPTLISGSAASFGGGPVPMNLKASSGLSGISRIYSITQQGLTANVSCSNYTNPADWYPVEVEAISVNATYSMDGFMSGVLPIVNTTLPRMNCNSNVKNDGMISSIAAINFNNSNYLASVVCPYTWLDAANFGKIVVYHNGVGKYSSLPPTICEIELLLTQSSVQYVNQMVTAIVQNVTTIPQQHNLNFWVTLTIELNEWGFQTAHLNSLGNMLLSLLTSGSAAFANTPVQGYHLFLEYWKGVVEVAGTALRSGYTAYPQNVTSMQTPVRGTQNITTMGWSFDSKIRVYALAPITLTALLTFAAIAYALYHIHLAEGRAANQGEGKRGEDVLYDGPLGRMIVPHTAIETFDASDPIHLIVASAAQQLMPGSGGETRRYWDRYEESMVFFHLERGDRELGGRQ